MAEARLATHVWVGAYLARLGQAGFPAYVLRRGDATAGSVLVKCATLDGQAVLWRHEWNLDSDRREWVRAATGTEAQIDTAIAREARFDPDLWVIELESREGVTLLDQPGLE
ncbi:DUF1491 family protein [Paracoccus jeotgali]|uniref:DUF1491 family protein n=1 Tax=Paracoccus jeotgali TaxID=2065379 RepID=UPI0028ACEC35|nr:DUF1491 family protein [Paracoccus jeotgali]